jgi:hypothetical protein
MTGEMSWIKADGEAADGNTYPVHASVARKLRSPLRPFDTYIGPYIAHKRGRIFISSEDGCVGTVCLWPGGIAPAFREPIVAEYFPLDDAEQALAATRDVLQRSRT